MRDFPHDFLLLFISIKEKYGLNIKNLFIALFIFIQCCQASEDSSCLMLTLPDAVSRALQYNRQLSQSVEGLTKAQYGVDLAESEFQISVTPNSQAGMFGGDHARTGWRMGGGLNIEKKFTKGTRLFFVHYLIKTRHHYLTDIQGTLTQPLLRGLGKEAQLAGIRGAQFAFRTAYRSLYLAQVQLILRTIQALYDIIKAEKIVQLQEESLTRLQKFYQAAQLKEKMGLSNGLDLYRAEIELRQSEDALTSALEKVEEQRDFLKDLLSLPLDTDICLDVPLFCTPRPIELEQAIQSAFTNRIEMDQALDEKRENERLARLAKHNLYPELNLVLNYSNVGRSRSLGQCSRHRENVWGIGFTTSTDFNPLWERVAYEQSLMAVDSALKGIDQMKATLVLDIKKTVRQLERLAKRMLLQEKQIQTAEGELKLTTIKFQHGMADHFHVLQAEKTLRTAQQHYWSSLIDHMMAEFQLLSAMGLLIDKPQIPYT